MKWGFCPKVFYFSTGSFVGCHHCVPWPCSRLDFLFVKMLTAARHLTWFISFVSVEGQQGLTCLAGPEFEHRRRTATHLPWRSGSSARPPTSLYSAHSSAGLGGRGRHKDRWMEKIKGEI